MLKPLLFSIVIIGSSHFYGFAQTGSGTISPTVQNPTNPGSQSDPVPLKKVKKQKKSKKSTNPSANAPAPNGLTTPNNAPGNGAQMDQVKTTPSGNAATGNPSNATPASAASPAGTNSPAAASSMTDNTNNSTTNNNTNQGTGNIDDLVKKSNPIVTNTTNGQVNWTNQYVEAIGEAAIDNVRFTNPAQAKLMAKRGAVVLAQRNLLEIVKGVNVTAETTVKDMITSSDYVYTRVDGVVKGAEMVGEAIEDNGIMRVKLRMPLYATNGLASAIYDNIPGTGGTTNGTNSAAGTASGNGQTLATNINNATNTAANVSNTVSNAVSDAQKLVINLGGKKFDPSLFPVVLDDKGNLLLDFKKLYDPTTGTFPQIIQASKELMNDFNLKQGVQVVNAIQDKLSTGKIVISNDTVKKINWSKIGNTAATIGKILMMFI